MMTLRNSRTKKARDVVDEAVSYLDELVRDERLRSDLRSALGHGTVAARRLREDSEAPGLAERLASDRRLKKSLRSMLEDLDNAAERARRKTNHRVRNAALILGGTGIVLAVVPNARRWIADRWTTSEDGTAASQYGVPLVDA